MVEKGAIDQEKSTIANGPSCEARKSKGIFHNVGNLLSLLKVIPASRGRVVSTEWQGRTVLGYCTSRAKVIPAQAPPYWQNALISDFLDRANLTTIWIKDRPEGSKLQNLALATRTGRSTGTSPENPTADVHYASNK